MIAVKLNSFEKLPILGRGKVYPFVEVLQAIFNMYGKSSIVTSLLRGFIPE